ncbi:flagellar assembly protein FliW [Acidaminobacter sp.]|uniref:flagellar assembly protein FliW n=1 Tax=Acidaminobacter sp. TaxID=1872102 RepID=UPI001381CE4D|nr:flagellar assembly protein FliW [Acidaminobacter sp.]MDK9710597.1 flagellar assembly protein FliW [Acidaminobacter sp.]MZQ96792.1 flagellar assembly protein FliW [Acidaminobacter sp.]
MQAQIHSEPTSRYNEVGRVVFSEGLPGFETLRNFELVYIPETSFLGLMSLEEEHVGFILTSPWNWIEDYEIDIPESVCHSLELSTEEDVQVLAVVTLQNPVEASTMNLIAPLVINLKTRSASQVVLSHPVFTTREPLRRGGEAKDAGLD